MKNILIVGATGLVGNHLVDYLLNLDLTQKVVLLNRHNLEIDSPKLIQHKIDFENIPEEVFHDIDAVFCCIGTTIKKAGGKDKQWKVDHDIPVALANKASKQGVNNFSVISSVGANPDSGNFYLKMKGKMEEGVKNSGIGQVNIFRPALLLGDRAENRAGEDLAKVFMPLLKPLLTWKWKKYRPVHAETVCKAMYRIAEKSEPGIHVIESDKIIETGSEY